jgi:rod shape-determining protein MreC
MFAWLRHLRGALVIGLFLGIFLYILSLNFQPPDRMDFLQRVIVESISPIVDSLRNITTSVDGVFARYVWLVKVHEENEILTAKVAKLEQEVTNYREAYMENLRLRRFLDFQNSIQTETFAAQVVLHDLTGWFQTLIIDKGFNDGIAPDMAVVNDEGVVGRIMDVSDRYSRILLITDPESSVDAVIQRNRVRGILSGKDASNCILKYVRGNLDVQTGDLVITSGKDGIFPKGLRLGTVQGIFKDPVDLFQRVEIKPLVHLNALEEVLILKRETNLPHNWVVE